MYLHLSFLGLVRKHLLPLRKQGILCGVLRLPVLQNDVTGRSNPVKEKQLPFSRGSKNDVILKKALKKTFQSLFPQYLRIFRNHGFTIIRSGSSAQKVARGLGSSRLTPCFIIEKLLHVFQELSIQLPDIHPHGTSLFTGPAGHTASRQVKGPDQVEDQVSERPVDLPTH